MKAIDREITVTTARQRVWDYLVDFTNTEEWDPPTKSTTRTSGDGGVGTVYRNVSSMMGKDVEIDYTVVQCEAPRLLQLRGETGSMHMVDTITLEKTPAGTTVHYRAEFHPEGAAKLAEPLMPLGLERLGDKSADQLERCLQQL